MENYPRYSSIYRAVESRQVMDWIKAGECGCIIGLRGSGKSNFIRFLLNVDTQQYYLSSDQTNFTFVLVNLLSLTERSEWGVYEMILNNLLAQIRSSNISDERIAEVRTLHQEIMRGHDVLIAKRAVEDCMALLCQLPTRRLVLLFDEFDTVFRDLPASLFRCLRAIRDSYKDQISYIVVATHDLAYLRNDLTEEVDHFHRLVTRNPCWLGPYSETDAQQMTNYLAFRRDLNLGDKEAKYLFELSGGHAGLLKAILGLIWTPRNTTKLEKSALIIAKEVRIQRECQKIWESLSEEEKTALCFFSNGDPVEEQALNQLVTRGLLRPAKNNARVMFSPVLALFVQEQAPPPRMSTYITRSPRVVSLNGQRIENLTELEFELLNYLYQHRGQVCTKNDLIENIYRQQYDSASDEMLHALILRLRKKIEPDPPHPRYIVTARGEGYSFILSIEQ